MALDILLTLFLVFLNGFFVAAEFAIVKVRSSRIDILAATGSKPAQLVKKMISNLDAYLSATQLGITLASLGLGWIGETVVARIIINSMHAFGLAMSEATAHRIALPISFAVITILHIVFGELAPKSVAIQRSESTTLAIAYPLNVFYWLFRPAIWVLNGMANRVLKLVGVQPASEQEVHSPEELRYLVSQGTHTDTMGKMNYDIIKNAFDFSDRTARQVMIPRTQVVGLNIEESDEAGLEKILDEGYSRIPVYKQSLDQIIGILYIKDLLLQMRKKGSVDITTLLRPASYVHESKRINDLLQDFRQRHVHLAVVVNEYGGTEGIISIEDIVEEIVGEIQDEYDVEIPIVQPINDQTFHIIGSAPIADINELLPTALPESREYDSLGGLIIFSLGRIPAVNEKFALGNYEFTILKKNRNNILLVQLVLVEDPEFL
jgi:CBS domain containing-hemolysin-like protein